jgi:hypothetical protein
LDLYFIAIDIHLKVRQMTDEHSPSRSLTGCHVWGFDVEAHEGNDARWHPFKFKLS